jgi:predicted  nucleic acid-binding Zn-ribbon protein
MTTQLTTQQLQDRTQQLESRIASLEAELAQIKQLLGEQLSLQKTEPQKAEPWWVEIAGSFENDPAFDEAVRLGQEWRRSAE